jgi:hypothetical protein
VLSNGVLLAERQEEECSVLLFQNGRFYVEIFFNPEGDGILRSRKFDNTDELLPYLNSISFPYLV